MERTSEKRKPSERSYLLVIGAPRSGTTLLATMIGRHTEVGMLNEDTTGKGFTRVLGKTVTGNKLCVPNQIRLRKSLLALRLFKKLGFIEESPKSRYSIEEYLQFPNLKVIAIIRDGNDTISSMMNRGKSSFKRAAQRWSQAIETIHELKSRYPGRVLVIAFEDLVLQPEAIMNAIFRFVELPFQNQVIEGYRYNPKYPESKLDQEKVHRHRREGTDFQLEAELPSACEKYQTLLAFARQPVLEA